MALTFKRGSRGSTYMMQLYRIGFFFPLFLGFFFLFSFFLFFGGWGWGWVSNDYLLTSDLTVKWNF